MNGLAKHVVTGVCSALVGAFMMLLLNSSGDRARLKALEVDNADLKVRVLNLELQNAGEKVRLAALEDKVNEIYHVVVLKQRP